MNIKIIVAMILLVIVGVARANITYVMNQYPQYQANRDATPLHFNLIGTITTDGTIGNLAKANIVSWQFTSTAVDNSVSYFYSSDSDPLRSLVITGNVVATPTEIQIPRFQTVTNTSLNLLSLPVTLPAPENISMTFDWRTGGAVTSPILIEHFGFQATRELPLADPWSGAGFGLPLSLPQTTGPIIVATIPEPASLGLLGMGVVGLLTRRRRLN